MQIVSRIYQYLVHQLKKALSAPLALKVSLGLLVVIWLWITIANFPQNAFFSGWDNLHPEFNFGLSFNRAIFGVWQEHQSLGHVGGHGYAATLPHTIIAWVLSIFLSIQYIRSVFTFLMLLTGSLGCFFLISHLLKNNSHWERYLSALNGTLFYMLGFGTVQQFYTQLEAFIIHFAALPWLIYLILLLLENRNKKTLFIFFLLSFLTSTQGFIPPLFTVYVLFMGIILILYLINEPSLEKIKTSLVIALGTLMINSYWLFPVIHYTFTDSQTYLNANNNILSTQSWIDNNNLYGNIKDLSILKGFPSQAFDQTSDKGQVHIFQPWLDHLANPIISLIGYLFLGLIVFGLFYYAKTRKKSYELGIVIFGLLAFSILASQIPGFSYVSEWIQKMPVFKQAFRAGFTKLSISLSLCYAIFLAFGILGICRILKKHTRVFIAFMIFLSIIFSLPAFKGDFIYRKARLEIPDGYFKMFKFFQNQPQDERITTLPQGDHWGWDMYRWGYSGSGFLWFGLPQPVTERAFDAWNNFNENYYWELVYTIYSKRYDLFEKVMDKYQINWIVFDDSFISFANDKSIIYDADLKDYLNRSAKFILTKTFPLSNTANAGNLYIYKVNHFPTEERITVKTLPTIGPKYNWTSFDQAYFENGSYLTDFNTVQIYYPFRSLFTDRKQSELEFQVKEENDSIVFSTVIPQNLIGKTLSLPNLKSDELISRNDQESSKSALYKPVIYLNGKLLYDYGDNPNRLETSIQLPESNDGKLEISIPKIKEYAGYDSQKDKYYLDAPTICNVQQKGESKNKLVVDDGITGHHFENTDSGLCKDIYINTLIHKFGYLVNVTSKHISGNPLNFYILNSASQKNDIEVYLPDDTNQLIKSYFVLPPMQSDTYGYSLRLANNSIGNKLTVNEIYYINIFQIPYDFLTSLKIVNNNSNQSFDFAQDKLSESSVQLQIEKVEHPNPTTYYVEISDKREVISNSQPATLILSQSFNPGWQAYIMEYQIPNTKYKIQRMFPFIFGQRLTNHVLVNNWENGWILDKSQITNPNDQTNTNNTNSNSQILNTKYQIQIIFWPQYLEYLGFILLPLPFLWLLKKKSN